jgi:hypothetical protein
MRSSPLARATGRPKLRRNSCNATAFSIARRCILIRRRLSRSNMSGPLKTRNGFVAMAANLLHSIKALLEFVGSCQACWSAAISHVFADGGLDESDRQFEGAYLLWKSYEQVSDVWDHDHCVYCWATFSLVIPESLTEGWAIQDDPRHRDAYNWICGDCIDARRELIDYTFLNTRQRD